MIQYKRTGFSNKQLIEATKIQVRELNKGFLSSFGEKALLLIFSHIAESFSGVAVLAIDETTNRVIGYVLGTLSTKKLYKDFILKKTPQALYYFLPKLLSYKKIKKAFETLLYPSNKISDNLPVPELLDLAVLSEFHGLEVARNLFIHFADELQRRGFSEFKIPTASSLTRAHKFYEKMGAYQDSSFTLHDGQDTLYYVYRMPQAIS